MGGKGGDTCVDSQISRINPGDQWGWQVLQPYRPLVLQEVLLWVLQAPASSSKAVNRVALGSFRTFPIPRSPKKHHSRFSKETEPSHSTTRSTPWPDQMKKRKKIQLVKNHFDPSEVRKKMEIGEAPDRMDFRVYVRFFWRPNGIPFF